MKLAVEFPNVIYREGPEAVAELARAIEEIGFDQLDMFDHVVMGHPTDDRPAMAYPSNMPVLEALMTLSYAAAATSTIGLGTEILILPQRQPTLVARQVNTLDILSGGRVRLGVGVGWQQSEYEALGVNFTERGKMMDEAIDFMKTWWQEENVSYQGQFYSANNMAMEPNSPQGANIPIWIGGNSEAALKRAGRIGDGWMASGSADDYEKMSTAIGRVKSYAEEFSRDPNTLGFQAQLSPPPRNNDPASRNFYANPEDVAATALLAKSIGFDWATINVTGVFVAGARSLDAIIESLTILHDKIRQEVGNA
ncbi:MAG TPA: LLM class F420-dependent oxidoreductase [Dehalococcoidia bacterium]|jgi:probable F420-dependent oxidoreductase|nr:LLM class F420-dependent oxidoreductase [Dehalococcoidia bacterium]